MRNRECSARNIFAIGIDAIANARPEIFFAIGNAQSDNSYMYNIEDSAQLKEIIFEGLKNGFKTYVWEYA